MKNRSHGLFLLLYIVIVVIPVHAQSKLDKYRVEYISDDWVVEQESAQSVVKFGTDTLEIDTPKGITIWYKQSLSGEVVITYKACLVMSGGQNDRLSDLNCFWMAQDPQHVDDFFARSDWRKGVFSRYYSLKMYYVGFGGNNNTTSRFRKYDGDYDAFASGKVRPDIIKEFTDPAHLLKPNIWYRVKIVVKGNRISYFLNGDRLFDFRDKEPYRLGFFGFRTVQSHQLITDLKIKRE